MESSSFHTSHYRPVTFGRRQRMIGQTSIQASTTQYEVNQTLTDIPDMSSASDLDEMQVLLACRSYLRRKHKLDWEGKKLRQEAAASPLFNEGYFWFDPNDLLYLRKNPDPFNLIDNETVAGGGFNYTYDGDESLESSPNPILIEENKVAMSTNPFSTNPLYPSEEHQRRSASRAQLWSNETWKELWYEKRWKGRKVTEEERIQKRAKRRVNNMPASILESPDVLSLSEEEVATAVISYIRAIQRMSDAKKELNKKKLAEREEFVQWKKGLKKEAEEMALLIKTTNATRQDFYPQKSNNRHLTFEPSHDYMKSISTKLSEKSKRAYQKRVDKKKASDAASAKGKTKFRQNLPSDDTGSDKSIRAILRINSALDNGQLPSVGDVEIILKPGRLGRRKAILLRILSECFGLRGKCVPKRQKGEVVFMFATTCKVKELGKFVLSKLRDSRQETI